MPHGAAWEWNGKMTHYTFSAAEIRDAADAALETLAWSTPGWAHDPESPEYRTDAPEFLGGWGADFSPAARASMLDIIEGFMSDGRVSRLFDLLSLYGLTFTPEQIGHDFILTANGHGAGFWDRDYRPRPHAALEALSAIVRPYGSIDAIYAPQTQTLELGY